MKQQHTVCVKIFLVGLENQESNVQYTDNYCVKFSNVHMQHSNIQLTSYCNNVRAIWLY